jgi:hypothetical protein
MGNRREIEKEVIEIGEQMIKKEMKTDRLRRLRITCQKNNGKKERKKRGK